MAGKFIVKEFSKICAEFDGHVFEAANEISIRNVEPTHAIRFKVKVNGKQEICDVSRLIEKINMKYENKVLKN